VKSLVQSISYESLLGDLWKLMGRCLMWSPCSFIHPPSTHSNSY